MAQEVCKQYMVGHSWLRRTLFYMSTLNPKPYFEQVAYWVCAYANNQHELGNVPRLQRGLGAQDCT